MTLIALSSTWFVLPTLWKDPATTFATVGGFVTIYGVVFAVIETWRARGASEQAKIAAETANRNLANLHGVKSIAECRMCIQYALADLEKDGWTSTSALSRIAELYTAEFHEAYRDPISQERDNVLALQSHAATRPGPIKGAALGRLKSTLLQMVIDMAAAGSGRISEMSK